MLQKINERIQGVFAWVMIILISSTFALFGIEYYMQARNGNQIAAEVNGQEISKEDFDLVYRRNQQARDQELVKQDADKKYKQQILNDMIMRSLTMQSALKNGFLVSSKQANSAIIGIPQFQEEGRFSAQRYQQAINSNLFTEETFQQEVQQGMTLNQQRFAFIGTAFALPDNVEQFVKLYMQTRDYDYLVIKPQSFQAEINVDKKAIEDYYNTNKLQFMTPEQVEIDYVQLSMKEIKDKINPSDERIKLFYDENRSSYNTPAKWHLAHILFSVPANATEDTLKQIQTKAESAYSELKLNPRAFPEIAKNQSDDKISALKDGELSWVTAGQADFDKSLLGLKQAGLISPPVKTKYGYQIFKVLDYTPAKIKPLADVESEIKQQLINEEAQSNYTQDVEQMSELSYQTPDTLGPVAESLHLPIKHSDPFTSKGDDKGIAKLSTVVSSAFSHDVLDQGNNSELIQIDGDSVIVLRVSKHIPAIPQTLEQVQGAISKIIVDKLAQDKAKTLGEQLLSLKANDKSKMNKILDENHLQWHKVTKSMRDNSRVNSFVNSVAFSIPNAGETLGEVIDNGDFVLVNLKSIAVGSEKSLDKERLENILQQLETSYGTLDYELFALGLLKNAKIVMH